MKVTRYNYAQQFPAAEDLVGKIRNALVEGRYVLGEHVRAFEERLAAFVGTRHAVGVNSGTDALVLALTATGIGPGDEVITVGNTFHASVLAIVRVGATPVLVDCTWPDLLMDADQVEQAVGPRTRAILAVHLFGRALDMDRLTAIARRHDLAIIEDCAQAIGARWNGVPVGGFGEAGCFSFHPSKNLAAAGDAGAVVTDREQVRDRLRVLRNLGQSGQNHHIARGCNSKLDEIQALVLDHKLDHLDEWNRQRRRAAERYAAALTDLPVFMPPPVRDDRHVYHLLQVGVPHRDGTLAALREAGVDAVVRYPVPPHRQEAFAGLDLARAPLPNTDRQARQTLCLPIRPDLTESEIAYVADALRQAVL